MVDVIVLTIIAVLTIIGLWKGVVKQFFRLLGIVAGYIPAVKFYRPGSGFLTGIYPGIARAVSIVTVFLAGMIAAHLIGWAVGRRLSISQPGFVSRIGGGFLGFLKGCITVSIMVMLINAYLPGDARLFKNSSTIGYIRIVTGALKKVTRADIKASPILYDPVL